MFRQFSELPAHDNSEVIATMNETNKGMTQQELQVLTSILANFVNSYEQKGESVSISDWLLSQLKSTLPEIGAEALTQIRDTIILNIQSQEEMKASLKTAHAKGLSSESWLAKQIKKFTAGMTAQEASNLMDSIYSPLEKANRELFREIATHEAGSEEEIIEAEIVSSQSLFPEGQEYNDFSLRTAAKSIAQSAGTAGVQGLIAGATAELGEQLINGKFETAKLLKASLEAGGSEAKAVLAGALETAVENGDIGVLPKGTPVETVTGIANIAVENVSVLSAVFSGKMSIFEALERVGDSVIETVCSATKNFIQEYGSKAAEVIGGFIGAVAGPQTAVICSQICRKFGEVVCPELGRIISEGTKKIYNFAKEKILKPVARVANSLWEGAKNFISNLLSW